MRRPARSATARSGPSISIASCECAPVRSATTHSDPGRTDVRSVRDQLVADRSHTGTAWCAAYTELVDQWLRELLFAAYGDGPGVALVAVGGYGRGELCPASDIDVMLVHDRKVDGASLADAIWYPIWDEGLHLGHRVSTVKQVLRLAADDLDTATALLSTRHVAGDPTLTDEVAERSLRQWR